MEATEDTIGRHRFVVLDEIGVKAYLLLELTSVETLEEIATGVAKDLRLDNEESVKGSANYIHRKSRKK